MILNMNQQEDVFEALHGLLHQSVTSRGNLLIATGGSLKPSKCFYHLISYSWKPDGMWVYDANEEREDLLLEIPLPDGMSGPIEHCGVNKAHKTLGVIPVPLVITRQRLHL